MRRIDEPHLEHPFAGNRMLWDLLQLERHAIGRKCVARLMRKMDRWTSERCTRSPKRADAILRIESTLTCCAQW